MKKRILSFIMSLALVFTLGGGLWLSAFSVKTAAADAVQSYDDSPIESDMANMEEADYPANSFGECSVVGFMEYCYSENSAYSSVYGLYVYVYNPTEKPLIMREGANNIHISTSFGEDGSASEHSTRTLTYLDNTDNHRFYKFKVTDSAEQYDIARNYAELWNGRRRYEITELNIFFEGAEKAKPFGVSKVYEFSGYAAWCGEPQVAVSTLECKYYGKQDIHLTVYDTHYRFAEKSDYLRDDLQSVYFAIPNEYYEQWGDLTEITAEWYEYKTSPMFVTSDSGAYAALFEMRNKRINEKGQLIDENGNVLDESVQTYWRVLWEEDKYAIGEHYVQDYYDFYKGYNATCRDDLLDYGIYELADSYVGLFKFDWIFFVENPEIASDYDISSDEVKKYIERYTSAFSSQEKLHDRYAIDLFERYEGDGYKSNTFNIDNSFDYLDTDENQSAWNKFWFGEKVSEHSYSPIVTIREGDLVLGVTEFSEKYLVNSKDVEKIIEFAKTSYENGEKPVILRFALNDYYASKARFDFAEENKTDMSDIDGYVAQEMIYLDFDILSMAFERNGSEKTVVGVVAESIDIINGLTAPEDIPIEEEEWWQKIMLVLALILLIVALSFLKGPIGFVIKLVTNGIVIIFKIILSIVTLPFNIIKALFGK